MKWYIGSQVQQLSNVDVINMTTTTVWTCGCNLKCFFCHNHNIVNFDENACKAFKTREELKGWLKEWFDIETNWVHVTGGEPTVQPHVTKVIVEVAREVGKKVSLNSNLTTERAAEYIKEWDVDHVAFDVKIPITMTGIRNVELVARNFVKNVKLVIERLPFEARFPVAKDITMRALRAEGYVKLIKMIGEYDGVLRVQKLVHNVMGVKGWSEEMCKRYCNASDEEVFEVAKTISRIADKEVFVYLPDKRKTIRISG